MSEREPSSVGEGVGSDLDAYRRHRAAVPLPRNSPLIASLDSLIGSADPHITFTRLAEICVPSCADGAQIELSDGSERRLSMCIDGVSSDRDVRSLKELAVVEAPFESISRDGQLSYAGILTLWWRARSATESDWAVAALLVKHACDLVEHRRLIERAGAAEARAASAAMEAIASRQVNLAVGLLMAQLCCSAADAEAHLDELAEKRSAALYTVAAEIVRNNPLRPPHGEASSDSRPKANVRRIRP